MEHVQRNRVGFDLPKGQGQIDQIFVPFTHPHDAPRTDLKACRPRMLNGGQTVLKRMGAADGGMIGLTRIEIVVNPVHPRSLQVLRLAFVEQPQGAADLNRDFLLN